MAKQRIIMALLALMTTGLSACGTTELASSVYKQQSYYKVGKPYDGVDGTTYYPREVSEYDETGTASWYGPGFHGKRTANGEEFDKNDLTAAHRTLPMPSVVKVTNLANNRFTFLKVNDRGPFSKSRIIDVSKEGATRLGMIGTGTARVRVQYMPQESMIVAESAKRGKIIGVDQAIQLAQSQNNIQVANGSASPETIVIGDTKPAPLQPVSTETLAGSAPAPQPAHVQLASYQPAAGVATNTTMPVAHGYYVQAGAFSNRVNADKLLYQLNGIGKGTINTNASGMHRVWLGPFASQSEAAAAQQGMAAHNIRGIIVHP